MRLWQWSSASASDSSASGRSSIEVREFYYDDDVVDVADWMTLTRGLVTHRQDGACYVTSASATSQDAVVTDNVDVKAADRTMTAGTCGGHLLGRPPVLKVHTCVILRHALCASHNSSLWILLLIVQ